MTLGGIFCEILTNPLFIYLLIYRFTSHVHAFYKTSQLTRDAQGKLETAASFAVDRKRRRDDGPTLQICICDSCPGVGKMNLSFDVEGKLTADLQNWRVL